MVESEKQDKKVTWPVLRSFKCFESPEEKNYKFTFLERAFIY